MHNPRVPAVHMNTRMIVTTESWFGGGADLNPTLDLSRTPRHPDTVDFHARLKQACDGFNTDWFPKYKQWADTYFWLPHRGEPRGVGGIFYRPSRQRRLGARFRFHQIGGRSLSGYPAQDHPPPHGREAGRRKNATNRPSGAAVMSSSICSMTAAPISACSTGGNVESILSSMPPVAEWQ